jgi:hypothetical protein
MQSPPECDQADGMQQFATWNSRHGGKKPMRSPLLAGVGYLLVFGVVAAAVTTWHDRITPRAQPLSLSDPTSLEDLATGLELRHLSSHTLRR